MANCRILPRRCRFLYVPSTRDRCRYTEPNRLQCSLRHSSDLQTRWAIPRHSHTTCESLRYTYVFVLAHVVCSYCLVGIAIMVAGVLYWAGWQILLPKVFGYELVPRKETLDDGTVITLVSIRHIRLHESLLTSESPSAFSFRARK